MSLRNLFNKLFVISLLWYDILDGNDKLSNLLHSKEQICNVTSQICQEIDYFSSYLYGMLRTSNLLHFVAHLS